ncbi:hypothetical protein C8R41DRAFT_906294 [Lentinula lateritia]|uniref:Uncharacterized protein n=1 Tax=Lentinula lateritia TaxID=40482 RepID=A0ABQ8V0B0_9AGAR|nr:hypothetical protein C8R41DRAFT_906294 [Lentinula lateritia]
MPPRPYLRLRLSTNSKLECISKYRKTISTRYIGLLQSSGQNCAQNFRQFSSTLDEDAVAAMDISEKTNHNDMPTVDDFSYQSIPRPSRRAQIRTRVIQTAIGYDKKKWYDLRRCVRDNLAAARIDWSVPWRAQNPEQIAPVFTAVEKHFPETRRFADRWAINQIAYQYGIQRNYYRRTERDFKPDLEAEDNVPAGSIPYSIPTYKVPMKDIRQALGYDKKRWNYLRTCVRENFAVEFDWSVPWRAQKPERLARAYSAVRLRGFNILLGLRSPSLMVLIIARLKSTFQKHVASLNGGLSRQSPKCFGMPASVEADSVLAYFTNPFLPLSHFRR